jgi:hypothetical protein
MNNNNTRKAKNIHNNITKQVERNVQRHRNRLSKGRLWGTRKLSEKNIKNLNETRLYAGRAGYEGLSNTNKFLLNKYHRYPDRYTDTTLLEYLKKTKKNLERPNEDNPYSNYVPTEKNKEKSQEQARYKRIALEKLNKEIKKLEKENNNRQNLRPMRIKHGENID